MPGAAHQAVIPVLGPPGKAAEVLFADEGEVLDIVPGVHRQDGLLDPAVAAVEAVLGVSVQG
jgi:hypothetical protein